jgi:hypothetical protein
MVFVMGSVIVTSRHNSEGHDLPGLRVGFLGEFVGVIRVLQGAFRMPLSSLVVPLFVMFSRSTVGARRKFMLLGGFPMCVVHGESPLRTFLSTPSPSFDLHEADQSFPIQAIGIGKLRATILA